MRKRIHGINIRQRGNNNKNNRAGRKPVFTPNFARYETIKNIRGLPVVLLAVLIFTLPLGFSYVFAADTNVSLNYYHNGTLWLPGKSTSEGILQLDITSLTATGAEGDFAVTGTLTATDISCNDCLGANDIGDGLGLTEIDETVFQQRVSSTCAAGSSIRVIAQDGTVTCEADEQFGVTIPIGNVTGVILQSRLGGISIPIANTTGVLGQDRVGGITIPVANVTGATSGTVTSIATSSPITGGTITTSGTIGISMDSTGDCDQAGYACGQGHIHSQYYLSSNPSSYITDGNTGWDNSYGFITASSTLTGLVQSTAAGNSYFTGGNVGIGTASPQQKLHVAGHINVTGTGNCIYLPSGGRLCGNTTCTTIYSPNGGTIVEACN